MKQIHYQNFIINHYQELESTNSLALQMIKNNSIHHNQIILADLQNSGRGRMGRNWASPQGNLYFSLVLKSQKSINQISQISFLAAVSAGLAIAEFGDEKKINYKWPNDILIDGKKTVGILLEKDADFVVVGIGVNINSHPEQTSYPAYNLENSGFVVDKETLLKKFLDHFSDLYQKWQNFGFVPIRNLWLSKAYNLGKEINVNLPNESLKGVFKNLDADGNLILQIGDKARIIASGEVFN